MPDENIFVHVIDDDEAARIRLHFCSGQQKLTSKPTILRVSF